MSKENHKTILVLNGPNLNLLGTREPEVYGSTTIEDLKTLSVNAAEKHGYKIDFRQTNVEGSLVDWVQEANDGYAGVILNAAAYTHTSVALHDAIAAISPPVIEVHISNVFAREDYRHHSFISDVAAGVLCGFGTHGYVLAIDALATMLRART